MKHTYLLALVQSHSFLNRFIIHEKEKEENKMLNSYYIVYTYVYRCVRLSLKNRENKM